MYTVLWYPLVGTGPGLDSGRLRVASQWVRCPATLVKTVKVRHGSQDHVGSDRRLVVGEVFLEFERLERLRAKLLTLGLFGLGVEFVGSAEGMKLLSLMVVLRLTNHEPVAIDWFTGGSCVV